ncbi:APC family permease [Roseobacter sp. HKCCA0434]|uniref:APC family permease n=1 Tax=Roseobacter sp. HKCCA0434 TaxID=3079297 RepID=UPI002905CAFC|nr:APC family permease [Roseobacter sp. HKCCA0434]
MAQGGIGAAKAFALAAGGMVGGGIYVSLGVIVEVAGAWAWASFALAGLVIVPTAWSYARLSNLYRKSGGVFEFLEEADRASWAGALSWLLIGGYTLTVAVYSFAFGHYLGFALGAPVWADKGLAVAVVACIVALNLGGVAKLTRVEIGIVSVNLVALLILGLWGVTAGWSPANLSAPGAGNGPGQALIGAAVIFISYEGFQLLTYEYDELDRPRRMLTPVMLAATFVVIGVYVLVALGAVSLAGAQAVIDQQDVALSVAARVAAGGWGLAGMTLAACCATMAAINSTLFSTAKLSARVARDRELPPAFARTNANGIPSVGVLVIGAVAAALAVLGSLTALVEAASLIYVVTFGIVNWLCWREADRVRWLPMAGIVGCAGLGVLLAWREATHHPFGLMALGGMVAVAIFVRPWLLRRGASG